MARVFLANRGRARYQVRAFRAVARRRVRSAAIAQLVEHVIRNDGVTGSSPVCGTTAHRRALSPARTCRRGSLLLRWMAAPSPCSAFSANRSAMTRRRRRPPLNSATRSASRRHRNAGCQSGRPRSFSTGAVGGLWRTVWGRYALIKPENPSEDHLSSRTLSQWAVRQTVLHLQVQLIQINSESLLRAVRLAVCRRDGEGASKDAPP